MPLVTSGLLLNLDGANYVGSGSVWTNTSSTPDANLYSGWTYNSANGGYFEFPWGSYAQLPYPYVPNSAINTITTQTANPFSALVVSGSGDGNVANLGTDSGTTYWVEGQTITISGVSPSGFNGTWKICQGTTNGHLIFQCPQVGSLSSAGSVTSSDTNYYATANNFSGFSYIPVGENFTITGAADSFFDGTWNCNTKYNGLITFQLVTLHSGTGSGGIISSIGITLPLLNTARTCSAWLQIGSYDSAIQPAFDFNDTQLKIDEYGASWDGTATIWDYISPLYPTGTWINIAGTWDGTTGNLFINGTLVDSYTGGSFDTLNDFVVIGFKLGYPSGGAIGQMLGYDRALTYDEIVQNYVNDAERFGLVAYSTAQYTQDAVLVLDQGTAPKAQLTQNSNIVLNQSTIPKAQVSQNAILVLRSVGGTPPVPSSSETITVCLF